MHVIAVSASPSVDLKHELESKDDCTRPCLQLLHVILHSWRSKCSLLTSFTLELTPHLHTVCMIYISFLFAKEICDKDNVFLCMLFSL